MPRRGNRRAGFTLLEMLLALTLMSILAGSLYASLYVAFRARDAALLALGPVENLSLALDRAARDLQSVLPLSGLLAGQFVGQDLLDDAGRDADVLTFNSSSHNPDPAAPGSDVAMVELTVASLEDGTGQALVRRITSNLLAPEVVEPAEEVLCRRVRSFNVTYFDGSGWLDSWDSAAQDNALPLAVELTVELVRSTPADSDEGGLLLSRVVQLPCAVAPEGTQVILSP
jgi:type II secretion system protein J